MDAAPSLLKSLSIDFAVGLDRDTIPPMTLTLELAPDLQVRLLREADRQGLDAKRFVLGLIQRQLAGDEAPLSPESQTDSELLEAISRGLPAEGWERYHDLIAKRRAETLTPAEYAELIATTESIEEANVQRVACLAELADRRRISIDQLMDDLGIRPAIYE